MDLGAAVRGASGLRVKCAFTDVLLQRLAVPMVFFYPGPLDEKALRAGLERALEHIPLFAGRVRRDEGGLVLECDNFGVPWSIFDPAQLTCSDLCRSIPVLR